ncbi:MAG: sigma-70 family RNA polymerase sigma factor [Fibrobacter sp.]|nr:sigma-70 family RNA polymerase sigma factor [Fibrobacter sp.]
MNSLELAKKAEFTKMYETYAPMVYRRCVALLKDDAEASDMMQEVFVRIFEAQGRLDLNAPSSLLWNTATRLCLNRIRDKRRRGLTTSTSELLLDIACATDEQDEFEAKSVLAKLFAKEPESSRTMAVLHFVDGMTLEETAAAVGLSVSGVRKRLRMLSDKVKSLAGDIYNLEVK